MKIFRKIWAWGKTQLQKPETHLMIGMVGGFLIGVGMDNIGVGIALAVALGVPGYATHKKKRKDDATKTSEDK